MKKLISIFIVTATMLSFTLAFADEKELLRTFERVRAGIESGINYNQYSDLMINLQLEWNMYSNSLIETEKTDDKCFYTMAKECHEYFMKAKNVWTEEIKIRSFDSSATRRLRNFYSTPTTGQKLIRVNWQLAILSLNQIYMCLKEGGQEAYEQYRRYHK